MTSKQTMIKKLGSEEAYLEYMRQIGTKGGSQKVEKGFSGNRKLAAKVGSIGGKISKRPSKKK